jgi:phosphoribosylformylglycinamidine synthase
MVLIMNYIVIKNKFDLNKAKLYVIKHDFTNNELEDIARLITNTVSHEYFINDLTYVSEEMIFISKKNGVTDDEGRNLQIIINDLYPNIDYKHQFIFAIDIISKKNDLSEYNPIIYDFNDDFFFEPLHISLIPAIQKINLDISDDELINLSKNRHLSLDLKEMKAIKKYFLDENVISKRNLIGMDKNITDCEIEIFAQTWSEHCKHKEFNAIIEYRDLDTGKIEIIDSLFDTYIKKTTEIVNQNLGEDNFLIKVFSDNAGVVRIDEDRVFTFKVETHNSPSAIDPYGGAITGILGNNRDPLGTGKGGGKLLFNTDVLCFASENYDKELLNKQLHPKIIKEGVIKGIKDGGNKSGIPTVNGAIIYDDRYAGKPLVFCGTGGIMASSYKNDNSWDKIIKKDYIIYMIGGRVGKDGIHGATFSSRQLDETSPTSAVQIGSPITQKLASDFLEIATQMGLISATTDNGAGGLSSSIGELATISNGVKVYLDKVPLKYDGLQPWEIFVSESQERFTLAVNPKYKEEIEILANNYSVEITDIGIFTDNGYLEVLYNNENIAYLDLDFLHNGVPKKHLFAEWKSPILKEPCFKNTVFNYLDIIKKLLESDNIKSRENVIRQYDHEVKGNTVLKSLMGETRKAPQDAAVVRIDIKSKKGIIVSNGIAPKYGDINAYDMSASAFDEAIRSIISVGGKFPNKDRFWSINDNFCVPNSVFDENNNTDGKYKLAQLVKMNKALYDMGTYFNLPFTSGKDSMKNDFYGDGVKISVPPTILYSVTALMDDIDDIITTDFKNSGDLIYQVGETYNELGGSEFYKLFGYLGKNNPLVRFDKAKDLYNKFIISSEKKLIESSHDVSDGGMLVALVEKSFGSFNLGFDVDISNIEISCDYNIEKNIIKLFSESNSRFIVTVKEENKDIFEEIFKSRVFYLGKVTDNKKVRVFDGEKLLIDIDKSVLLNCWEK